METEINMPKFGMSMVEGEVVTWFKKEGDAVEKGEAVLEISENKAIHEVNAMAAGVLKSILVQEGETVPVGAVLGLITS